MGLETLLAAAKYLEYQALATSRGEIPMDYQTFASSLSFSGDDSSPTLHLPSSSDASTGDNSHSCNDDTKDRRRGGGSGTREVHNKLEKNRRAHLKKCFETLRKQIPNMDEKKTSNLGILRSAFRYIHSLNRKEREMDHDMERLAHEKILRQQRLIALRKELSSRVDEEVITSVAMSSVDDNDSNSTSTASECGPPSDTEEAKPFVYTQASLSSSTAIKLDSHGLTGSGKGPTVVTAQRHAVTATASTAAVPATTTPPSVGHQIYGRTLAPHPPVLASSSVVHGVARSGAPATLTFGPLPPRLQLSSVGFPAQGFHHASPTLLTHPTVQVLTTQQPPVRLIATPVGAATGSGVTLTMGTGATSRLAYAAASGTVLTAAQQQLPVTATLASMQGGGATRLGTGASGAVQPGATIAFAQLAVKPENGAFSALTTAAALSFKNSTAPPPIGSASPSVALPTTNGTTNHLHNASNTAFARQLVAAAGQQPQQQQMVVPMAAGFLHQFLPQLSAGKPLVVVTAAPSLPGGMAPPQTIVAQSLPVSR